MTTQALTLTDFLLARIAEDERHWGNPAIIGVTGRELTALVRKVRAECEAKRRIVETCRADYEYAQGRNDDTTEVAEEVMWFLALPYADHPDYRDEWRP